MFVNMRCRVHSLYKPTAAVAMQWTSICSAGIWKVSRPTNGRVRDNLGTGEGKVHKSVTCAGEGSASRHWKRSHVIGDPHQPEKLKRGQRGESPILSEEEKEFPRGRR